MNPDPLALAARRLARRLDELGRVSDERGRLTRTFLSPAMRRANRLVAGWMRAAGLTVREDGVGNLIGRAAGTTPGARTLLLGSHLDTVKNAGRFDGPLGVLLPITALAELRRRGIQLPFAAEVLGFSEEEGVRFASAYIGSKGFTGTLGAADLARRDGKGTTVQAALDAFGRKPFVLPRPAHRKSELLGYLEVHIEQGPVLEAKRAAVGVVSAIAGQTRGQIVFRGRAGHAGTTPMAQRRDALAGAAEWILSVEALARRKAPLVATVGTAAVSPGAPNVIPAEATLSLDLRHPRDGERRRALRTLLTAGRKIARNRRLTFTWRRTQDDNAVACSPELTRRLAASVRAVQGRPLALVSGAGHDGVVVSALAPVAMLFVRCHRGLSHHPDEFAAPKDLETALRVVVDFLTQFPA